MLKPGNVSQSKQLIITAGIVPTWVRSKVKAAPCLSKVRHRDGIIIRRKDGVARVVRPRDNSLSTNKGARDTFQDIVRARAFGVHGHCFRSTALKLYICHLTAVFQSLSRLPLALVTRCSGVARTRLRPRTGQILLRTR